MFRHLVGILFNPHRHWQLLRQDLPSLGGALAYPLVLAALPAIAWYYGVTQVGWSVGGGDNVKLTPDSAGIIVVLFYLTQVIAVAAIGYMVHWMSRTYGVDTSTAQGIAIAGLAATPLFLAGLVGFYPIFWLDLLVGLVAVCHAVYLLYLGIPIVMNMPEERGFLFSSAVIAVCLVCLIMIMGGTVILWDMGAAPRFTD